MPELPEVTTTTNGINRVMKGRRILDVWCDWPKMLRDTTLDTFHDTLKGRKFLSATRRAKNILLHFDNDVTLLMHLKMTGHVMYGKYKKEHTVGNGKSSVERWVPDPSEKNTALHDPYNRFIHVVFVLDNNHHLVFCDSRKFGKLQLLKTSQHQAQTPLRALGPEPLDPSLTFEVFKSQLHKRMNSKIKTVLMDQTILAGIGNIYSDEILFEVGLHPEERVVDIPNTILKKMFQKLPVLLNRGIDFGGDSTSDYRNIDGERGKFQGKHQAYRRTGKPCLKRNCSGVMLRRVVGGRSAHFCSMHQQRIASA